MNTDIGDISIFWFRRDLRLQDNVGLYHALSGKIPVLPVFIFDTQILDQLQDKKDRRVAFIHEALQNINAALNT
ncbi:MAG: deoxyribodipyrimidine photo-lyase, partial [Ginsengibacter sp.]